MRCWTLGAVSATALLVASAALASEPTIMVEGNHRLGLDSVRAFFHQSGDGQTSVLARR